MKAITYANAKSGQLSLMVESALFHDITLEIIGMDDVWNGFTQKLKSFYKYLIKADRKNTYMFVDGYDTLFANKLNKDYEVARVTFSAERNCHPFKELGVSYPTYNVDGYRFINSGGYVGKGQDLIDMFEEMNIFKVPDIVDDQGILTAFYLSDPDRFDIDYDCNVFQTLFGVKYNELDYSGDLILNTITGSYPVAIHGNGGSDLSKTRDYLLQKMRV